MSSVRDIRRVFGKESYAYVCTKCKKESFNQEPKLWAHAKATHAGQFDSDILTKEGEAKERPAFKSQAAQLA